jgi:hypothetical protein
MFAWPVFTSPDVFPPLLLEPPVAVLPAVEELPPESPPADVFDDETDPPDVAPDWEALPLVVQAPPLLHVSAELLALPLMFALSLLALPPDPDALPPVAVPPLALASPLIAVAPLWSTEACCDAFTLTVTLASGFAGFGGFQPVANAAGTTARATNAASATSSHRVFADTVDLLLLSSVDLPGAVGFPSTRRG